MCAFLHPDAIPEEILTEGAAILGPQLRKVATEPLLLNDAIQLLRRYSLVKRDAEAKLLNMHRLVQVVLKESLDAPTQQQWAERALLAVNTAFPSVEYNAWPKCERLLSQALTAAQLIEQYQIVGAETGRLLHETATYLRDRARYTEAEPLYSGHCVSVSRAGSGASRCGCFAQRPGEPLPGISKASMRKQSPCTSAPRIHEHVLGPEHPGAAPFSITWRTSTVNRGSMRRRSRSTSRPCVSESNGWGLSTRNS